MKENEIELYCEKAFAYLVLDPERRGKEISKCKIFDDYLIPNEVTKKQCLIFEAASVVVPKI